MKNHILTLKGLFVMQINPRNETLTPNFTLAERFTKKQAEILAVMSGGDYEVMKV